jgi:hypothetical protein
MTGEPWSGNGFGRSTAGQTRPPPHPGPWFLSRPAQLRRMGRRATLLLLPEPAASCRARVHDRRCARFVAPTSPETRSFPMSEHISWATCPHCGQPAAVGWVSTVAADGEPTGQIAVRFDCVADCQLSAPGGARLRRTLRPGRATPRRRRPCRGGGADRAAEHGLPRHLEAQGLQRRTAAARRRRPAAAMDERLTERAPGSTVPPPTAAR